MGKKGTKSKELIEDELSRLEKKKYVKEKEEHM